MTRTIKTYQDYQDLLVALIFENRYTYIDPATKTESTIYFEHGEGKFIIQRYAGGSCFLRYPYIKGETLTLKK